MPTWCSWKGCVPAWKITVHLSFMWCDAVGFYIPALLPPSPSLILSRGRGGMVKNSRHFWRSVKNLKFKNHRIFLPFKRFKYLKTVTPTVQNEIIELIIVDRWTNYFQQLIKVCFHSCVTVHNLMDLFCFIYLQVHYNIFWIRIFIGFSLSEGVWWLTYRKMDRWMVRQKNDLVIVESLLLRKK